MRKYKIEGQTDGCRLTLYAPLGAVIKNLPDTFPLKKTPMVTPTPQHMLTDRNSPYKPLPNVNWAVEPRPKT